MNINSVVSQIDNKKNVIIFLFVGFFAFHALYFLTFFRINYPYGVDSQLVNYLYSYLTTGIFPFEELLETGNNHYTLFPKLIILPNLLLNSFDIMNILYLDWAISCLSLFLIFLILRKTDLKVNWLLIPISALIFSPLPGSNEWSLIMTMMLIPQLAIIVTIYSLNKTRLNIKSLTTSISAAIIAMFSSIIGIVVWMPIIFSVIWTSKKNKQIEKKVLIILSLVMIVIALVVFGLSHRSSVQTIFSQVMNLDQLLTFDTFSFIATYLSSPFRLKYPFLKICVGIASIFLSIFLVYYFMILKKKTENILPWLSFLLVGITSAIITALGRAHLKFHYGDEPYYIPTSQFFQIGLVVMIGLIIIDIKNCSSFKRKKIILTFLYLVIISQTVLLIPSYYAGWQRSEYYYQEKSQLVKCFSLSHGKDCVENDSFKTDDLSLNLVNYFLKNNLSIFKDKSFNQQSIEEVEKFEQTFSDESKNNVGFGKIEKINNIIISNDKSIIIDGPLIIITGWTLDHTKKQMDSIYLLVDGKPLLKYDDFELRIDIIKNLEIDSGVMSGWTISLLSGYVEKGCHEFAIAGTNGKEKIILEQKIQLCKINL